MFKPPRPWAARVIFLFTCSLFFSPLSFALTDITGHKYQDSISFLLDEGVISGYPDGTFQADRSVNRVEFLKIVLGGVYDDIATDETNDDCGFSDTVPGQWYIPYLCLAVEEGIVKGYPDGTFKPEQTVNFVEAAKISTLAFGQDLSEAGSIWYLEYVDYLSDHLFIPPDVTSLNASLKRGQVTELLSRFILEGRDDLAAHLWSQEFDFVFFDAVSNVLKVEAWSEDLANAYLGAKVRWLTHAALALGAVDRVGNKSTFKASAAEGGLILANYHAAVGDGLTVDIDLSDAVTVNAVQETEDSNFSYEHSYETSVTGEAWQAIDDDVDSSAYASYSDESLDFTWSETMENARSTYENSFIWSDEDGSSGFDYQNLTDWLDQYFWIDLNSDEDETSFDYEFQQDLNEGPIHNWAWQSSDAELVVYQTIKEDLYSEFLGFVPTDEFSLLINYEGPSLLETLDFVSESGDFSLDSTLTQDSLDETLVYSSDSFTSDLNLTEADSLDGSTLIHNGSDSIQVLFDEGRFDSLHITSFDEAYDFEMTYDGLEDAIFASIWSEETGTVVLLDGGPVEHGVVLETDEISITPDVIQLRTDFYSLDYYAKSEQALLTWDQSDGESQQSGDFLYDEGFEEMDMNMNFGDESDYKKGGINDNDIEWYKDFDLSFDPTRLISGEMLGGFKGKGMNYQLGVGFSLDGLELGGDIDIEKEDFEKHFSAITNFSAWLLEQQMRLKGQLNGFDIDIDTNVTVDDGDLEGSASIHATGENTSVDFDVDFDANGRIILGGNILVSPPSWSGTTFGVGLEADEDGVTARPKLTVPLHDGDDIDIDAVFGGEFSSDGTSRGSANIRIRDKGTGATIEVGGTFDEGGNFEPTINVGLSW